LLLLYLEGGIENHVTLIMAEAKLPAKSHIKEVLCQASSAFHMNRSRSP